MMTSSDLETDGEGPPDMIEEPAYVEVQALTPSLLRRALGQIRGASREAVAAWREQLGKLPRGSDFDSRGFRLTAIDRLKRTGEKLAKAARGEDQVSLEAGLARLKAPLEALGKQGAPNSEEDAFLKQHASLDQRIATHMALAVSGLKQLADITVRGAADLDPHSVERILERKRDLGDATLRRIEDKIATTRSRKEKKRLQEMRDDMRNWLANRDARLESVQPVVDELALRVDVLRNACLVQSRRLARAAELTTRCFGPADRDAARAGRALISREGMEFSACLRAMLLAAQIEASAPLEQS